MTTAADFAHRFSTMGFSADDARSRVALVEQADHGLLRLTNSEPSWRWLVPGRLEVFGKHTDYGGGRTLVAAVPRGFAVAATERPDRVVRVYDTRNDELFEFRIDAPDAPRGWRSYVAVTAQRLAANFPGAALGADIAFTSDLPRAAGMSSSSALIIALANVLIRRGRLEARPEWTSTIPSIEERVEYFGCVENGDSFRSLSGARGVGTEGGSEDHAAILMSRPGGLTQFTFMPLRRLSEVAIPGSWRFVIASSGVHAAKAGSVRDRYNRAARAARAIVEAWNRATGVSARSLADVLSSSPDTGARLRDLLAGTQVGDFAGIELVKRLDHFVRENDRVPEAVAAFEAADHARLGDLSHRSHVDANELLGNQVPETNDLVETARACGAFAASSFGAGFGGSVWALIPADDAVEFGAAWRNAYVARYPHRVDARWFVAHPAPGLLELSDV